MTDKPKPLTKAEWEAYKRTVRPVDGTDGRRVIATLDELFRYRERTKGMIVWAGFSEERGANEIAAEIGIE